MHTHPSEQDMAVHGRRRGRRSRAEEEAEAATRTRSGRPRHMEVVVDVVDSISNLPDAILGEIVSLLPTKEAGRTQVLARRWRHIWRSAPLNLECHGLLRDDGTIDMGGDPGEYIDGQGITRILSTHQGPGHRLRIPAHHMQPQRGNALDAWLMSPALNRLEELELYHRCDNANLVSVSTWPPPPAAHFTRFAPTLHVATLSHCKISDRTARSLGFPSLKMLALEEALLSETSLQSVLTGCPVLQNLLLRGNVGSPRVRIVSRTIKSIAVHVSSFRGGAHLKELIVEDGPCLERLLRIVPDSDLRVTLANAPRLQTLGCLTDMFGVTKLNLGLAVTVRANDVKFTEAVRSVKILAFSNNTLSLDVVINFMDCFPCLESLYIESTISREKNLWCRKHRDRNDIRLKNLVLGNYQGTQSQVNFATFFIMNARLLKSIRFEVKSGINIGGSWIENQHSRLLVKNVTSTSAKLHFRKHHCRCTFTHVENVRDLSVADPFACRC